MYVCMYGRTSPYFRISKTYKELYMVKHTHTRTHERERESVSSLSIKSLESLSQKNVLIHTCASRPCKHSFTHGPMQNDSCHRLCCQGKRFQVAWCCSRRRSFYRESLKTTPSCRYVLLKDFTVSPGDEQASSQYTKPEVHALP